MFLPFDLEFTYGAALHLIMASTLFPGVADDQCYAQHAHKFLDEMIHKGNRVAEVRKAELVHLETLCQELAAHSERRGLQTLTLEAQDEPESISSSMDPQSSVPIQNLEEVPMAITEESQGGIPALNPGNLEFLDNIGISSGDFFSIVDQMGDQNVFPSSILDPHLI